MELPSHELMLEVGRKLDPKAQAGKGAYHLSSLESAELCHVHCRESVVSMQGQVLLSKDGGKR